LVDFRFARGYHFSVRVPDVRLATQLIGAVVVIALGGCVNGFRGSNIQLDLLPGTPVQARVTEMPDLPRVLPANSHFTIYAIQQDGEQDRLFEVQTFEIHRLVDRTSPCFIDVGENVPHPGLHVTRYAARIAQDIGATDVDTPPPGATERQKQELETANLRIANVNKLAGDTGMPVNVVSSASASVYPSVAAGCGGPDDQIPPPECMDDASNQLRLTLCQAAWRADAALFEGTDRVLTAPLNGVTHGMLFGLNPINMAAVGGAQFFVDEALANVDAYAIYFQVDGGEPPGTQLFFGQPTMPTRGVTRVRLVSPSNMLLTAEMAIFADLGEDDVHF
jgi:hypothetical protein